MALPITDLGPFDPNIITGFIRAFIGPTRTDDVVLDVAYGVTGIPEYATWLYLGVAGNINYEKWDGTTQILLNLSAGIWHRLPTRRILSASTTATNLVWGS